MVPMLARVQLIAELCCALPAHGHSAAVRHTCLLGVLGDCGGELPGRNRSDGADACRWVLPITVCHT